MLTAPAHTCAGSPTILERSGIGRADVLKKAGVDQIVDLPGVGESYQVCLERQLSQELTQSQDHQLTLVPYRSTPDADTADDLLRGEESFVKRAQEQYGCAPDEFEVCS